MKIPKREDWDRVYKLDNCPFCEGAARLIRKRPMEIKGEEKHVTYVKCRECYCRSGFVQIEEHETMPEAWEAAVEKWNKRVPF